VAKAISTAPSPVAVMGDLNMTPWSTRFRSFLDTAGLRDNPQERGLTATWISRFPVFGLMIDHILTGPDVRMLRSHLGRDVGSDHLPIVAHLALNSGR
jgi:endonuclease/exonuclease/phosphatase (EEP) superfamily protein YafD